MKNKIIGLLIITCLLVSCSSKTKNNYDAYNNYIMLPNDWQYKSSGVYGKYYSDFSNIITLNKLESKSDFEFQVQYDISFWAAERFSSRDEWKYTYTDKGDIIEFIIDTPDDSYKILKGKIFKLDDGYEYVSVTGIEEDVIDEIYKNVFKE